MNELKEVELLFNSIFMSFPIRFLSVLVIFCCISVTLARNDTSVCHVRHFAHQLSTQVYDDMTWFTHIPKTGGRIFSYWMISAYSLQNTLELSRSAKEFQRLARSNYATVFNDEKRKHLNNAFSHDRPEEGYAFMRNFVGVTKPIKMVTMLRDVHSHRLSMVRKYVAKNLLEELIARKIKPHNTRLESICFADWLSLDGPDVHWRNQTYSQPQLGPQPIGYKVVKLDGARSYQLKWVARGRKHPGEGANVFHNSVFT